MKCSLLFCPAVDIWGPGLALVSGKHNILPHYRVIYSQYYYCYFWSFRHPSSLQIPILHQLPDQTVFSCICNGNQILCVLCLQIQPCILVEVKGNVIGKFRLNDIIGLECEHKGCLESPCMAHSQGQQKLVQKDILDRKCINVLP